MLEMDVSLASHGSLVAGDAREPEPAAIFKKKTARAEIRDERR